MKLPGTGPGFAPAIDVHAHYGRYLYGDDPLRREWLSAEAGLVAQRAAEAGIECSVVSPLSALLPRGTADAGAGNDEAFATVPRTPGFRQWVVVNPLQPATFPQAETMLRAPWCVGIKIHPEEHAYSIREHGRGIFEFAARLGAVVLAHSGGPNSRPADFVPWADAFPAARLILAHLGLMDGGDHTHQVRAIQAGRQGNLYTDTSSSKSIYSGLIEWAVREVGAERILFGTDAPIHFTAMQRMRVERAEIADDDKRKILSENARRLLPLGLRPD